jgi:hypothetical protein
MQKQKPIIETSLSERADERERGETLRFMTRVAGGLVNLGLVVSAVLTVIYLMLLVDDAMTLPDPYGLLFGLLVGIVAIVPAELALIVWRERLAGDAAITSGQRATAVTALFLAGIFAALTTSSFFSYFLPQLFSPSYIAIAPALNVGAIVGSWVVFIMAIVFYSITSRETKQNLSQAKAEQSMFDARISVLKAAAEAIRTDAENTINAMEQNGIFERDARRLIIASLGMDDDGLDLLPEPADHDDLAEDYDDLDALVNALVEERLAARERRGAVDLVDLAERQVANGQQPGNGGNFTRRPGSGRGSL